MLKRTNNPEKRAERLAELELPPFPKALKYLWLAYFRIRRRKGSGGFGVSPIEWPDIDAFVRNSRLQFAPWEISVIEDIDDIYLNVMAGD